MIVKVSCFDSNSLMSLVSYEIIHTGVFHFKDKQTIMELLSVNIVFRPIEDIA